MKGNVILTGASVNDFDHALSILDSSIAELRRVAHNMVPEALVRLGLNEALSDLCNELDKVNALKIIFQFYGEFSRLDTNLEINAYRIVQELINNAIKHSGAKELVVQIVQEPIRICFIVRDDGIGFDYKSILSAKGIGFSSVKSIVDSFNGQLQINSSLATGSEITVEFST